MRRIEFVLAFSALLLIAACGGNHHANGSISTAGGNTIVTSGENVAPLIVDAGPVPAKRQANVAFTTVVVCAPGTANCVTIDHVGVDTGSTGLRIPASLLSTLGLQNVTPAMPTAECVRFLDNTFFWGAVQLADVKMGGSSNSSEVASSVPIHAMGDSSVPSGASIPSSCSGIEEDTVDTLGANGRLGVGNFQFDCDVLGVGNPCTSSGTVPPGTYFSCTNLSCSPSAVPLAQQVRNPVSLFAADNNGVILELPAVPVGGQMDIAAGQGSMVFGIGTESNNGLSSNAVVLMLDSNVNDLDYAGVTTKFNGVSYPHSSAVGFGSFLDSGSNGMFFLDQPTSGITDCSDNPSFYCPMTTLTLNALNQSVNGNSHGFKFDVSSADTLLTNNGGSNAAFADLAGPNSPGTPDQATQARDGFFDWGLPVFYGRNVYTAIDGVSPPAVPVSGRSVPAGAFWAY